MPKEQQIVAQMLNADAFSQWLGVEILALGIGHCSLQMKVRQEMTNGFGVAHGGIAFSLSDSALAFAANSHGKKAMTVESSLSLTLSVVEHDVLVAEAKVLHHGRRIGVYEVTVTNQREEKVAFLKGTVYYADKDWEIASIPNTNA